MEAYRVETTLPADGVLTLDDLPFRAGEAVEVIILARSNAVAASKNHALRGTPVEYIAPFEPVAQNDWEALQ